MPPADVCGAIRALPTGFASLDSALGIGGLPRGRIIEIFGPPSCGKTSLALQIGAYVQRNGAGAAWIDAEHAFDAAFAGALGVDVSHLPVAVPDSAEQASDMAYRLALSGALDLIVIDSAAALIPQIERDADLGTATGGLHSRALASALRRLAPAAARNGVVMVFLNQSRIRPDSAGAPETSAGGAPLKLYAAIRIALAASGRMVQFRIVKNKVTGAFSTGILEWHATADGARGIAPGFTESL